MNQEPRQHSAHGAVGQVTRRSTEASKVFQCAACMAPGRYLSADILKRGYNEAELAECYRVDPSMRERERQLRLGWPGCYVEPGDPREGQEVGGVCPNCGAVRPDNEYLGEISVTEFN